MEYNHYNAKAFNLHMIKTNKFKTITIMVTFKRPIKKEEITLRSFIHHLLLLSNKTYPKRMILAKKAEELYGPNIVSKEHRVGNYALTYFYMTMINEKHLEEGLNEKAISFFTDIIFNPNADEKGFDKESFKIVKNEITARIQSLKEDSSSYSLVRMLEQIDPDSPLSYRNGYLDEIDKIDEVKAYEYYKSMIHSDLVDVYVLGDIDFDEMKHLIINKIPINTVKINKHNLLIKHNKIRRYIKTKLEEDKVKQAKLVIGCKITDLTEYEYKYVLPLYSNILGGPSYSKLFDSVREKNSLAYYIYSNFIRGDNLLTISSGINKDNFKLTLKLIKKEMDNISKGKISDEELSKAKENILGTIKSIEDNPFYLTINYMWQSLYKLDDIEARKKNLFKVTIEDIKKISKKIKIDTVYMLHGGDTDERD